MGHGELRTAAPVEKQLLRAPCEVGLSRTLVDVLESVVLAQSATDSYTSPSPLQSSITSLASTIEKGYGEMHKHAMDLEKQWHTEQMKVVKEEEVRTIDGSAGLDYFCAPDPRFLFAAAMAPLSPVLLWDGLWISSAMRANRE